MPCATRSVATEFNRYNDVEIRVEGEAVRSRRLIGTLDSDDPESLVRFLALEDDLDVERAERTIIIRAHDSGDTGRVVPPKVVPH